MKPETIALLLVGVCASFFILSAAHGVYEKRVSTQRMNDTINFALSQTMYQQEALYDMSERVSSNAQSVDRLYNRVSIVEKLYSEQKPSVSYSANAYCTMVQNGSYVHLGCRKW
jgi:hypothetical protein